MMTMFGSAGRLFANGLNANSAGYGSSALSGLYSPVPVPSDPWNATGAPSPAPAPTPTPMPIASPTGGFQPHALTFGDKLGLAGDIWTGNPVTQRRLDSDFDGDVKTFELNAPKPQLVPGVGLVQRDPTTGQNRVLVPEPPKVPTIAENASYLDSQQPGLGKQYLTQFATNGGGQGPATMVVNGQTMMRAPGAATGGMTIHPEAVARLRQHPEEAALFDQQFGAGSSAKYLNGGAVPATGPGGFPVYPHGH